MEHNDEEDNTETPELPLEIIIYILSFLQHSDRKEASVVCRSWYNASQDLQFQKNVTFRFPASSSSLELIRGLERKSKINLIISQLDGFTISRRLLLEVGLCLGPKLESLALPGSSITEASLLTLLPHLTSLHKLDLRGLDSLFMSGTFLSREDDRRQVRSALCGLEELDLSDLRYLSDITFRRLTDCTPRLRRLSLAGCHIAFEFDPYLGCPVGAVEDLSALLSLRNVRRLLSEQRSTLKALDLSRTSVTPQTLCSIAKVQGLFLKELCLHGCKELTDNSVEALVHLQPGLQRLDVSGCSELSSRSVVAVARGLKAATHLSLSCNSRVTERGLADLLSVPSLRCLDLSECPRVNGTEMVKGLTGSSPAPVHLETLSLRGCSYIQDPVILSLAQSLGSTLRELDLTSCVSLTDLSVHAIATYLQGLVVLRLGWCKEVTDWGLLGTREGVTKREPHHEKVEEGPSFTRTLGNMGFFQPPTLPFEERPCLVTQSDLELSRQQAGASLLLLRGLRELDLSACCKLTDSSIVQVVRHQDLQRLVLSRLPEITDESLVSVSRSCPSLVSLALSHCPRLSDHGVAQAAPSLGRLRQLHLSCCNVTDRSLFVLVHHCHRLRTLDVSNCRDVSETALDVLQRQLPFLNCQDED